MQNMLAGCGHCCVVQAADEVKDMADSFRTCHSQLPPTIYPVTTVLLQVADELEDTGDSYLSTSRAAVLADAEALLTCYGVGE